MSNSQRWYNITQFLNNEVRSNNFTLVPWDCCRICFWYLTAQTPVRHSSDILSQNLFHQIQQSLISPHFHKCLKIEMTLWLCLKTKKKQNGKIPNYGIISTSGSFPVLWRIMLAPGNSSSSFVSLSKTPQSSCTPSLKTHS